MLTQAPLPSWTNLFRALVGSSLQDAALVAPWHRDGEVAGMLSRSAWSLALIALWRKSSAPVVQLTVWLPDYFCNSSLGPLRCTGPKLVFYPLDSNMMPDMAACRKLMESSTPDLFVLVYYFGKPCHCAPAKEFCRNVGAWLIEDATHVLKPVSGVGEYGDFVLYSPHKHLPIPDGAVLVFRPNGPAKLGQEAVDSFGSVQTWPSQLRILRLGKLKGVSNSELRALVWLIKRTLQKLGFNSWRSSEIPYEESFELSPCVETQLIEPSFSNLGRRMLSGALSELGAVARLRQRHQLLWDALLISDESNQTNKVVAAERSLNRDWTPYLGSFRVDAEMISATYEYLHRLGLPVTTWPDLPPEVITEHRRHANALYLRHSRLYLPVHQSLGVHQMLKQCRSVRTKRSIDTNLHLDWGNVSSAKWQEWIAQADRSNMLQLWAYGQAKIYDSGWSVKRGVFYCDKQAIAVVQLLQKRIAGVLVLSRINRGPLLLRPLSIDEQWAVWDALARLGSLWHRQILSVAPELEISGSNLAMMKTFGFRQFSPYAWESIWVDLRMDLPALRKRLDGKWRNMLTFAEKSGLTLNAGCDDPLFEWMMKQYEDLMQERGFNGPPVSLLKSLRENLPADAQLVIMRAISNGEPVAAICLLCHGSAATYLLGWNGAMGRRLKANQFLLWQAACYLKQKGLRWFDLGGISEEHTPGITAFKLGMGGARYELVGEYWKW